MDYIETPRVSGLSVTKKKQPTKKQTPKKDQKDMNKQQLIKATAEHKQEIKKLKQDIKRHKLLIKQAKLAYKITTMKGSK